LFLVGTPIAALAVILALMLKEDRLRETSGLTTDLDALPGGESEPNSIAAVVD
jgi:hypothetical protein